MLKNNTSLGQHWLKDRDVLADIAAEAELTADDTVLEIGPGLGTLTSVLLSQAGRVVAVEYDTELARKLPGQFPGKNLTVYAQNVLDFDLSMLPEGYKCVANVPYYITSKIVHMLMNATHRPSTTVLLVQREVAERLAARAGDMSILAISAQVYADVSLGEVVPAGLFTPPPKVDSQTVILRTLPRSRIAELDERLFFRIVRAGFSAKRKKIVSALVGGLSRDKQWVRDVLVATNINPDVRAETLSIDDWTRLVAHCSKDMV